MKIEGGFWVYMVRCKYGTYYTGWTNDLAKRMAAHNIGKGAKYLRGRGPLELVYQERCASVKAAQKRERAIKNLTRRQKEELVKSRL